MTGFLFVALSLILGRSVISQPTGDITSFSGTGIDTGGMLTGSFGATGGASEAAEYASELLGFSSQYSPSSNSARQVLGAPDFFPEYGDNANAWSSLSVGQMEYLEVAIATPLVVRQVRVFETLTAGGVVRIATRQNSTSEWVDLWTGEATYNLPDESRIFCPELLVAAPWPSTDFRIDIDQTDAPYWMEIDAFQFSDTAVDCAELAEFPPETSTTGAFLFPNETFAARVIAKSSESQTFYWSASQAIGPPNVYPSYGNNPLAWQPRGYGTWEYIELEFPTSMLIDDVCIYETYTPGGVVGISVRSDADQTWESVWHGTADWTVDQSSRKFCPPITALQIPYAQLRLDMDLRLAPDYYQIDAVSISGAAAPPSSALAASSSESFSPLGLGVGVGVGVPVVVLTIIVVVLVVRRHYGGRLKEKAKQVEALRRSLENAHDASSKAAHTWQIDFSEMQLGKQIGRGAFGVVYRAKWRAADVVVKQLRADLLSKELTDLFKVEAINMQKLRPHPCVINLLGVCTTDPHFCIVTEWLDGGGLVDLLYNHNKFISPPQAVAFMIDTASGMAHLHSEHVLHCDLSARNLLLYKTNKMHDLGRLSVKVSDFGLSNISEEGSFTAAEWTPFPVRWSSPEVLNFRRYSTANDVWSFAVTCWEILERVLPYNGMTHEEIVQKITKEGYRLPRPTRIDHPDFVYQIMLRCLSEDPDDRPSFQYVVKELQMVFDETWPELDSPVSSFSFLTPKPLSDAFAAAALQADYSQTPTTDSSRPTSVRNSMLVQQLVHQASTTHTEYGAGPLTGSAGSMVNDPSGLHTKKRASIRFDTRPQTPVRTDSRSSMRIESRRDLSVQPSMSSPDNEYGRPVAKEAPANIPLQLRQNNAENEYGRSPLNRQSVTLQKEQVHAVAASPPLPPEMVSSSMANSKSPSKVFSPVGAGSPEPEYGSMFVRSPSTFAGKAEADASDASATRTEARVEAEADSTELKRPTSIKQRASLKTQLSRSASTSNKI